MDLLIEFLIQIKNRLPGGGRFHFYFLLSTFYFLLFSSSSYSAGPRRSRRFAPATLTARREISSDLINSLMAVTSCYQPPQLLDSRR
jgi:hypothetical protein